MTVAAHGVAALLLNDAGPEPGTFNGTCANTYFCGYVLLVYARVCVVFFTNFIAQWKPRNERVIVHIIQKMTWRLI